jgi:hypothetical protein
VAVGVSVGGGEGRSVGVVPAIWFEMVGEGVGRPLEALPPELRDRSGMTPE